MAPGPETAAVWQQKLISPLCCHRPTLVSRSKQWPACSSYRAWPPAFLTGGPPYNQENVNPHRELLHNVLLSHCPGRSKEDHTHCWAYSKAHLSYKAGTQCGEKAHWEASTPAGRTCANPQSLQQPHLISATKSTARTKASF